MGAGVAGAVTEGEAGVGTRITKGCGGGDIGQSGLLGTHVRPMGVVKVHTIVP
jgi:hypothetical protein